MELNLPAYAPGVRWIARRTRIYGHQSGLEMTTDDLSTHFWPRQRVMVIQR